MIRHIKPNAGAIMHHMRAPTHCTAKMARNILKLSRSYIYELMKSGKLQYELHYGEKLIPMELVMAEYNKRRHAD